MSSRQQSAASSPSTRATLPASHSGAGVVRVTEDGADVQVGKIQNGTNTKTDSGWGGMEFGNAHITGKEGPTLLQNGTGRERTMDGTPAGHPSHQSHPTPSSSSRSSDLPGHNYSQESTHVPSTISALHQPQASSSAMQYPVTAKAVQASLGRQEVATLPQAYPPQLPNMAYSRPLTSASSQYPSDSTYSSGMPHPLSQDTSSYTLSDQSDHSLLPGELRPPVWGDSSASSPTMASSVDILMLTLNILSFSFTELSEATGDFTEDIIGIGTFGTVFRAKIRGNGPYAIKKLHNVSYCLETG